MVQWLPPEHLGLKTVFFFWSSWPFFFFFFPQSKNMLSLSGTMLHSLLAGNSSTKTKCFLLVIHINKNITYDSKKRIYFCISSSRLPSATNKKEHLFFNLEQQYPEVFYWLIEETSETKVTQKIVLHTCFLKLMSRDHELLFVNFYFFF